ncbi:glycosyl hydrolase [Plectosphaerella cucumerina]|uniref:alpha-glucosidase n=1 Tax=Plectosphaerella cucumerina TaxID=40658 RepID=A0A8K0X713_9PEZI|nr:glycosyl hydrolase [Plectosphaerella cucumerina]
MQSFSFPSHPVAKREAIILGSNFRLTILTDGLFRYEWSPDGQFEDRASTFAINRDLTLPDFSVENSDILEIETERYRLTYDKQSPSPGGFFVDLKGRSTHWETRWRYGDFNSSLGGTARTLDNVDGRIDFGPGVVSKLGFAAIDDSTSMLFDANGWVTTRRPDQRVDCYVFAYGRDYKAAVKALYALSGNTPELPRWSLGNWWSRFHRYSAAEYLELMDKFKAEGVPLSVAVLDMDWHLVEDERVTTGGWTGYTWNRKLFPDPKAFSQELRKRHLRLTLNDHPADGIHAFEDQYEDMAKALNHDTSRKKPILFDPENKEFMEAYLRVLHRGLENDGCDFWWIDWQQGQHSRTGIDPLWMLNHFHFLDNAHDGRQPLVFSRYAGPGSHRYPIGFSGDTVVSWASLDFQPEYTATASNIGYGWWSHDIGGHMFGVRDDELVTRWVQLGVFSPIMRLHSTISRWQSKEPWSYRAESQEIITRFLRLRHRMIPYLHTMNTRAARTGEPLVQPMYWQHPELDVAYKVPNQYIFGSELMVCPITKPRHRLTSLSSVRAWFPPGKARYIDIFTGMVYDAGCTLELFRPLGEIPVFAREGSIVPLDGEGVPENGGHNPGAVVVLVVVGEDAKFEMVESSRDDLQEPSGAPSERRFDLTWDQQHSKLTASLGFATKAWSFRFLRLSEDITAGDVSMSINGQKAAAGEVTVQRSADPEFPGLDVSFSQSAEGAKTVEIHFSQNDLRVATFEPSTRISKLLLDFQIEFVTKDAIWSITSDEKLSRAAKVAALISLGIEHEVLAPILELVLAGRH